MNNETNALVAYPAPSPEPLSYYALIKKFGQAAFSKACAEAKTSPLSVQDILEREERLKQPAAG